MVFSGREVRSRNAHAFRYENHRFVAKNVSFSSDSKHKARTLLRLPIQPRNAHAFRYENDRFYQRILNHLEELRFPIVRF